MKTVRAALKKDALTFTVQKKGTKKKTKTKAKTKTTKKTSQKKTATVV